MIIFAWLLISFSAYLIVVAAVLRWRVRNARSKVRPTIPFTRRNKSASYKVLFMGDSTAVGIGASSPKLSVAGRFGDKFPDVDIENRGVSGYKIADMKKVTPEHHSYNLVVLQIGANDILRFTPMIMVKRRLAEVLNQAKIMSKQIVIIHGGNIGAGPLFPWPLKLIYDWRTRKFRQLYRQTATDKQVAYADIYKDLKSALAIEKQQSTYGPDLFHPGDLGYQIWFEEILRSAAAAGFELPN